MNTLSESLRAARGLIAAAENRWGAHPFDWPDPPHRRPLWWQFDAKRRLADLEAVFGRLDNESLTRWWRELRKGQSVYEDAGGYLLRCYCALISLPTEDPYTYEQALADLIVSERG